MTATETATVITAKESAGIAKENAATESVVNESAGVGKENVTGHRHRLLHLLLRRRVGAHRRLHHPGTDITGRLLRRADEKFSIEINSLRYGEGILFKGCW